MKTQCPHCKARFNTNEKSIGKQAKCPKCGKPFTIEPFIETPVAAFTAKHAETAESPDKIGTVTSGVKSDTPPVKSPEPAAPPAKIVERPKQEKPESRTLSKTLFVYCWIGVRIIAGILGLLGLVLAIRKGTNLTLIATFAAADVFLVCSVLIELALFYRMWAAIQDDQASISPGKAVGFLFIPVFNIYWALLMIAGFAEDYNAFIQRRSVKTKDLPLMLFVIYAVAFILVGIVVTAPMICVFAFAGLISRAFDGYPLQAWLLFSFIFAAGIGHFITYILFAAKTCNAINALAEKQGR